MQTEKGEIVVEAHEDASALPWLKGGQTQGSRLDRWSSYAEKFEDINNVIELTLTEARDATRADGGTVYIVTPEGRLRFAYFQNETLSKGRRDARDHYINAEIPMSERSIVGYAALTKQTIIIDDVSKIAENAPYTFNSTFDESSGYRTKSMLTVPMIGEEGRTIALLQLVNSLSESGRPQPFGKNEALYAEGLARRGAPFIERALEILRSFDESLHDEDDRTRFRRVGSYAAEIFESWARAKGISNDELMMRKDRLRIAAMANDIRKSGGAAAAEHAEGELFSHIARVADVLGSKGGEQFESVLEELKKEDHALSREIAHAAASICPTLNAIANRYASANIVGRSDRSFVG